MKGADITTTGSGSFGDVDSWSITETVTPIVASDLSTSIGDVSMSVRRTPDTELAVGNDVSITKENLGTHRSRVNRVQPSTPGTATLSADSALHPFLSGRMDVPGIESGLPLAALDVAAQAAGFRRQKGANATDNYWSLAGHSIGFTPDGDIVQPTAAERELINTNILVREETVLFQEISGFCGISDLAASGYPRAVLGDTPRLAREKARIKFTIQPSVADSTTTFELSFGPGYRWFSNASPDSSPNLTRMQIVFTTLSGSGSATASIRYSNVNGGTATVSGGTGGQTVTTLSRSAPSTVTIELAQSTTGALELGFMVHSAAGASGPYYVTTPALAPPATILYAKQWKITQNANGGGISDLVTRDGNASTLLEFAGIDYAAAPTFINQLASTHGGAPIAAFNGELWEYLKQVASARQFELAITPAGLVAREPAIYTTILDNRASASVTVSDAVTARNVAVTNQNTTALIGATTEAYKAESIYNVDVRETKTFSIRVPEGVRFIWSPRPWYNSKARNGLSIPSARFADGYAELEAGTMSRYYVTGADGFPVNPFLWTDYGGRVSAIIKDGVASLTLTGPREAIPGVAGPFKIGESDGSVEHAVLRIMGAGVTTNPTVVTLPSGADRSATRVEASSTITNPAIGSLAEVFNVAAWAAQRVAGPTITLTAALPISALTGFGFTAGSLVSFAHNTFRIDTVTISNGVASITASRLTRLTELPKQTRTLTQFEADHGTMTSSDFSIRALMPPAAPAGTAPAVVTQPSSYDGYYGSNHILSAAASGDPVPTVQWQRSVDNGVTWVDVAGATTPSYTLTVYPETDGRYRAVFTNASGTSTSNDVTVFGYYD
ncbi:MAG: Mannan endo,4-beta-mannosidase Cellulase [Microbacterium sp.]|nr:Mannan endo,4-beta-mannosidase Cellulase [Microbacterium sp.]